VTLQENAVMRKTMQRKSRAPNNNDSSIDRILYGLKISALLAHLHDPLVGLLM
jgi:hypothetical protein